MFLEKFKGEVNAYEFRLTTDTFDVDFDKYWGERKNFTQHFEIGKFDYYLNIVNEMEGKVQRLQLLLCYDRGMIWSKQKEHFLKENRSGWVNYLRGKGIWAQSVQHYINFYELVNQFNRVLVSTAAWSNWIEFMSLFLKELKNDDDLRAKVSLPLNLNLNNDSDIDDEFDDVMNDLENLQAS